MTTKNWSCNIALWMNEQMNGLLGLTAYQPLLGHLMPKGCFIVS